MWHDFTCISARPQIEQVIEAQEYSGPTNAQEFLTQFSSNLLADDTGSNLVHLVTMITPNKTIGHSGIAEKTVINNNSNKISPFKISPTKSSSAEVSPTEVGFTEVRSTEFSSTEVSPTEVGTIKIDLGEVRSTEFSSTEVGTIKIDLGEVGVTQVDLSNIRGSSKLNSTQINSGEISFASSISSEQFFSSHNWHMATILEFKGHISLKPIKFVLLDFLNIT